MHERQERRRKKGVIPTLIGIGTLEQAKTETDQTVIKYGLDRRLDNEQLPIFKAYFASYRVLRSKDNSEILDAQKNVEFEAMEKFSATKPFWNLLNSMAETVREVSEVLREEGDKRSRAYIEKHGDTVIVSPAKLQRVANMVNTQITNIADAAKRERVVANFLNTELPPKET